MAQIKKYALIMAGGAGLRAGGDVPKQFQLLCGLPVLWWSVKAFWTEDPATRIRIVMHPGFFDLWDILYDELPEEEKKIPFEIVCGGRTRLHSVMNGLEGIDSEDEGDIMVAVHDGARPLVSAELIGRGWKSTIEHGPSIPVIPMTDSIREVFETGSIGVDRSKFVRVQTPQVFPLAIIKAGYEAKLNDSMTDDASVVENCGYRIHLYPGDENNIKITNPLDFKIAEILLQSHL